MGNASQCLKFQRRNALRNHLPLRKTPQPIPQFVEVAFLALRGTSAASNGATNSEINPSLPLAGERRH